ncbi:HEPN domain-containing protein [Pedobacter sp. Hv1]|uniref:HEPN domain-containing protein n=1 Tax=Pedobacter sp. Hv1 TaxID=1740090 RepID=UPI0006D8C648|nr:HEPN domain-containing protein [Pedobacter sp. Hv1]KQB99478.1 hypothetical protein AQF98_18105 [Pedobacter sp. Hv1]
MQTLEDNTPYNDNVLAAFFDKYNKSQYTDKLWSFYRAHLLYAERVNRTASTQDRAFYNDLLNVLQHCKQLKDHIDIAQPIKLQPYFVENSLVSLEGVIELIKRAIPVGIIYNLSRSADELDLVVVLEKNCTKAYQEFEDLLDLAQLGFKKGQCTVHSYGLLHHLINNGHVFYNTACVARNVIYQKNNEVLFNPASSCLFEKIKLEAETQFKVGMDKALHFYEGAQLYIKNGLDDIAMFMLQQACELTYRCLLHVLRGKGVKSHSPMLLRKHLKRFAPEIIGVFSPIEEEEIKYLQLLEDAYVNSRYNQHYKIAHTSIVHLNNSVALLQQKATHLFQYNMDILDRKIMEFGVN